MTQPMVTAPLAAADGAQVLGLSESNVGVRLTRARQMLRRILERKP